MTIFLKVWLWLKWLCYENPWPEVVSEVVPEVVQEFLPEIPCTETRKPAEDWFAHSPYRGMLDVTVCTAVIHGEIPHKRWPTRPIKPRTKRGI